MPTETEKLFQTILEKIQKVRSLLDVKSVESMSFRKKRRIVADLRYIGATLSDCPPDLKSRCNIPNQVEMERWRAPGVFSPKSLDDTDKKFVLEVFDESELEIRQHAFSDDLIQNGVLTDMYAHYEHLTKEWHAKTQSLYIIIPITAIFVIVRFELRDNGINLTVPQYYAYSAVGAVVLGMVTLVLFQKTAPKLYIEPNDMHYTNYHFYINVSKILSWNILCLNKKTKLRQRIHRVLYLFWVAALCISIYYTPLTVPTGKENTNEEKQMLR